MIFRFENSSVLTLLLLGPALLMIFWLFDNYLAKKRAQILGERLTPLLTQSVSQPRKRIIWLLSILSYSFVILAWARPQGGSSSQKIKAEGVEMVLLVDVSESMMAEDLRPNRLTQARAELEKLIDLVPGNKTGIVGFAGQASLLSPLTNDPAALKMYLDSLSPFAVSTQGTCVECGLKEAESAFQRGGQDGENVSLNRVIIVASDGEDHEQGAIDKAQELAKKGFRIFTIAYGTEKGGAIPVRDQMGFMRGFKKDRSGQTILSQVKGDFLKGLAQAGNGEFYFSTFGGGHIQQLSRKIDQIEKSEFDSQIQVDYNEFYQLFLFVGIVLMFFALLISQRRKSSGVWRGRFEVQS